MSNSSESLAELQEQRDFLLNSLRDLEREHKFGDIDDQDYESLRKEYVSRAAAVIKQIEKATTQSQSVAESSVAVNDVPKKRISRRTFITLVIVLAVAISSGWFVAQQSGQRLAGDSLAGSIEDSTASILSRARATNFV
ncbi:MAG: hypothetical protein ACKOBB_12230, partial [Acidimicrobiaceae bacterium]